MSSTRLTGFERRQLCSEADYLSQIDEILEEALNEGHNGSLDLVLPRLAAISNQVSRRVSRHFVA